MPKTRNSTATYEMNHVNDETNDGLVSTIIQNVRPYYDYGCKTAESMFKQYVFPNIENVYNNGASRVKILAEKRDNVHDFVSELINQCLSIVLAVYNWFYIRVCNIFSYGLGLFNEIFNHFKSLFLNYYHRLYNYGQTLLEPYFEKYMITYFWGLFTDFLDAAKKVFKEFWCGKLSIIDVYRLIIDRTQEGISQLIYKFGNDSYIAIIVSKLHINQILDFIKFENKSDKKDQ